MVTGDVLILSFYLEGYPLLENSFSSFKAQPKCLSSRTSSPALHGNLYSCVWSLCSSRRTVRSARIERKPGTWSSLERAQRRRSVPICQMPISFSCSCCWGRGPPEGTGIRHRSPFSPSSFLPFIATDSESSVGKARQESDLLNLGAFYSIPPMSL